MNKNKINLKEWCLQNDKINLIEEWDYLKNEKGIEAYTKGSNSIVWWKCSKCGHEWETKIGNRTFLNRGCPICARKNAHENLLITVGQRNNMAKLYPYLLKEWDYQLNEREPEFYGKSSDYYAHWICSWCGNKYVMQIKKRTNRHSGCPLCAKQSTSFQEQAILFYVKKIFSNAKNREMIGEFEFDIYIPEIKTGIEYDGLRWHIADSKFLYDNKKDQYCKENGITLIRFRDPALPQTNFAQIIECKDCDDKELEKSIIQLYNILGVNVANDINISRDVIEIVSSYENLKKENSLAFKYPEIAKEWNFEKNGNLTPDKISWGNGKNVWWKCSKCGHEWKASPNSRTKNTNKYGKIFGCEKCGRKNIYDSNCLKIKNIEKNIIYKSLTEAADSVNGRKGDICDACNGKQHTAFGYHWEYVDSTKRRRKTVKAKIRNVDTGEIFKNSKEAAKSVNGDNRKINECCNGKIKTYHKYHWEYMKE